MSNIQFYRYRKYERFKDLELDELKKIHEQVENGTIDLKKEKMKVISRKDKISVKDIENLADPTKSTQLVQGEIVRVFVYVSLDDKRIRGILDENKEKLEFIRQVYSNSTLTTNEVAFLIREKKDTLKYYLKKYGIKKVPEVFRIEINNTSELLKFLSKPIQLEEEANTNETEGEMRERYSKVGYQAFKKLERLVNYGEEVEDEVKNLNTSIVALNNNLKLELEAKRLVRTEKAKDYELKEKEIEKNSVKAPVVVNFNGDIDAQTAFIAFKESLTTLPIGDMEKETILQNFANTFTIEEAEKIE